MPRFAKIHLPVFLFTRGHVSKRLCRRRRGSSPRQGQSSSHSGFGRARLWLTACLLLGLVAPQASHGAARLVLRWDPPVEITAATVTPVGGRTLEAPQMMPGQALFPPLPKAGSYELQVEAEDAMHRFIFEAPSTGQVTIVYRPSQAPDQRFVLDHRPVLSGEITVTPRKRRERALKVPQSIAVLEEGQLEAAAVDDLSHLDHLVSNLDVSLSGGAGGVPGEATVYLRGVGQIEPGIFADPGIGIYLDGMYIARSQGAIFDFLEVERVEVLRGPQGTLFGKNSTGGAISLITRRPQAPRRGRFGLTLGNLERVEMVAALEGAIGPRLNASVALRKVRRDGYTHSLTTGQTFNDEDGWSARGAFAWQPTQATRLDVSLRGVQERETALDQTLLSIPGAPLLSFYQSVRAAAGLPIIDQRFVSGDLYTSFSDYPSFSRGDIFSTVARFSHQGPKLEVLSITGYRQYEYSGSSDFDGTPIPFFARSYVQEQDQFSQEVQLTGRAFGDRLRFVLGGLYFEENPTDVSLTDNLGGLFEGLQGAPGAIFSPPGESPELCDPGPPPNGFPCFGGPSNPLNGAFFFGDGILDDLDIETRSWALFGEASLSLSRRLSLSAGVRWTEEEKSFDFFTSPNNSPDRRLQDSETWQEVSPRLSLSYAFNDDVTLYASTSHGFKSGGFNAGRSLSRAALNPYDQETLWSYEAGFKGIFLDSRLQITTSLFHYDYDDIQFASFLAVDNDFFFVIQNAAEAELQGFELELEARPGTNLSFNLGVGHVDSQYTDLKQQGGASLNGVVPKTPRWNYHGSLQYIVDLKTRGSLVAHLDAVSKSKLYNDVANSESIAQATYSLLNTRLMFAPPGDRWEIALFATNLSDEAYLEHGFAAISAGLATGIAGRPREWGVSVLRRF